MTISGSRILITGAGGFIGSYVARACVREGADVTCLIRRETDPWRLLEARERVRILRGDLTVEKEVRSVVAKISPQIIFHLAADTDRRRDLALYDRLHDTHVKSTEYLLSAALSLPEPPRFVHTGTIEEYGKGQVPFREDQTARPISPYSLTKLAATELVLYAAREHGLSAVVLRPSLTYGPLKGRGMFIPDFFYAAFTAGVFDMSTGEQTRDFIHVEDVAAAHLAAAKSTEETARVFNVATGVETKLKTVAEQLRTLWGDDMVIHYGAYPSDPAKETMRSFMDIRSIRERLSWEPRIPLAEGLAETADWYKRESSSYEKLWS